MTEPKETYCRLQYNSDSEERCSEQCKTCKEATAEQLLKKNFILPTS